MAVVDLNTARGRLIHDTAARLLAGVGDPNNPLTISDCLALAELRVRADELRRDPASDPNVIIKLEGLIDRRMRRLGLDRKREPAAPDLRAQFRAAYGLRAGEKLEADAAIPLTPLQQVAEAGTDSVIDDATATPAPHEPGGEEAGP
jgi:hypothetical protein